MDTPEWDPTDPAPHDDGDDDPTRPLFTLAEAIVGGGSRLEKASFWNRSASDAGRGLRPNTVKEMEPWQSS